MIELENNSWYIYKKNWLEITNDEYKKMWKGHPKDKEVVKIYGKTVKLPRYQKIFLHDYYYSGVRHIGIEIDNDTIKKILYFVRKHSKRYMNGILVNYYRNGDHYIGNHSDDTRDLFPNSPIYSITLGSTRKFVITNKTSKEKISINLKDESLLIMGGEFQKWYLHGLPKCKNVDARINLTFRHFKYELNEEEDKEKCKIWLEENKELYE